MWPIAGQTPVTNHSDKRRFGAPRGKRKHAGVDLVAAPGSAIVAAERGKVFKIQGDTWVGDTPSVALLIDGPSGRVNYGELAPALAQGVEPGMPVEKGQLLGILSTTGTLHIELYESWVPATLQWDAGAPVPPPGLRDPTKMIAAWANDEAPPDEAPPDEAPPDEAPPDEAPPDEAPPARAKPARAKPARAKPARAKPAKPARAKPVVQAAGMAGASVLIAAFAVAVTLAVAAGLPRRRG